uniref:Uncharacterized protein n=1 Tax=Leersia perrieri TaxID=77586 RepID=A0A0D9VHA1_9ORYZ
MGGDPCDVGVEPRRGGGGGHRLMWRGLGRRRKKLPVVRLGGGRGGGRSSGRGLMRRLRLRWKAARWLRRAVRRLAAIYMAALTGLPAGESSAAGGPAWIGVDPLFGVPFVPSVRHFI